MVCEPTDFQRPIARGLSPWLAARKARRHILL